MGKVRFVLRPGYEDALERDSRMLRMLERVAGAVAAEARRIGPVATGDYVEGIRADVGVDDLGGVVGRVNAHDFKSWWIEAGTSRTRAHAPLRRALESGAARRAL